MKNGTVNRLFAIGFVLLLAAGPAFAEEPDDAPAEAEESSAPDGQAEQADQTDQSVFEKNDQDPNNRRRGRPPEDGWFPIPNTRSELRFSGFVQLNVIHDFEDAGFNFGDFIPSQIPVPTEDTPNTEFDVRTSRIVFESRTTTEEVGTVSTLISMDFAGDEEEGEIQPRLRQAYVTWVGGRSNISFTAGQAWTTYVDLGVWPDIFDLEGPNAMTGLRQGLVRGSYAFGERKDLVVDLSLEQPETAVANGSGLTNWPDLVARANWKREWGHLRVMGIVRDLVAESTAGTGRDSATGWGLSLSGQWRIPGTRREDAPDDHLGPRQDGIQFQVQTGSGIGRYVFDPGSAPTPQDAVYDDDTSRILPLDETGVFVAYRHWWTNRLRSQFVYGRVGMDNLEIQPPGALRDTAYALANVIYRVFSRMDVGFEYYWGERENADGQSGDANRFLFGVNYGF